MTVRFGITAGLGAFLLFLIQPLLARFILPWFGGGPSVWTTCMLFFQTALLAGYAWAHGLASKLSPRAQVTAHLAALALALVFLPAIPSEAWKPTAADAPAWRILLLLTATIGWPFVVLAATAPLLQRWLCRFEPEEASYRLYAWSNGGSILALAAYPFLVEPLLSNPAQSRAWSALFFVFVLAVAAIAWQVRTQEEPPHAAGAGSGEPTRATSKGRPPLWLALAALGSALLLSATNKICQDVASTPMLWILPLALYLISFVVVFHDPKNYQRVIFVSGFFLSLLGVAAALYLRNVLVLTLQVWIHCFALFFGCMCFHGELARLKPGADRLTAFYLALAAGGALGGAAISLLAPAVLDHYYELQLTLLAGAALLMFVIRRDPLSRLNQGSYRVNWAWLAATLMVAALAYQQESAYSRRDVIHAERNFFGSLMIHEKDRDDPAEHRLLLQHGNILHGAQWLADDLRNRPTSYFGETGGGGIAFRETEDRNARRIGVIGLGAGTLAVYGRPGDSMRFYEIDPAVAAAATNHFTFLKDSAALIEIVPGDARLSLEREPKQAYDLLVLDAFSSDAIPTHLLTREAFELYLSHLAEDGVIALHLSNRHLDLPLVVWAAAYELRLETALIEDLQDRRDRNAPKEAEGAPKPKRTRLTGSSTWMLLTRDAAFLQRPAIQEAALEPDVLPQRIRVWTDDYSALFPVMR